jgi:hypothetical protein
VNLCIHFQIFICDLVSEKDNWQTYQAAQLTKLVDPKNNEQQVWNQTLTIATDIIGMLRHSSRQSLEGTDDINAPIYFTKTSLVLSRFKKGLTIYYAAGLLQ